MIRKSALFLIAAFAIIVSLAAVGFGSLRKDTTVFQTEGPKVSPIPATEPLSRANWETYKNTEYGFKMKYPNNWVLSEIFINPPLIGLQSKNNETTILIFPIGEYDSESPSVFTQKRITIGSHPAVRVDFEPSPTGIQLIKLYFLDWFPGNRIEIRTTNANIESELVKVYEILLTFTFSEVSR